MTDKTPHYSLAETVASSSIGAVRVVDGWFLAVCVAVALLSGGVAAAAPDRSPGGAAAGSALERAARAGEPGAQYRLAKLYRSRRKDAEYLKWLGRAAAQGFVKAQDELAFDYALGRHVRQSYRKAAHWYRRAAAQGDPQAECELGLEYAVGLGVGRDPARAEQLYRKAAARGYQPARTLLPY